MKTEPSFLIIIHNNYEFGFQKSLAGVIVYSPKPVKSRGEMRVIKREPIRYQFTPSPDVGDTRRRSRACEIRSKNL